MAQLRSETREWSAQKIVEMSGALAKALRDVNRVESAARDEVQAAHEG